MNLMYALDIAGGDNSNHDFWRVHYSSPSTNDNFEQAGENYIR